MKKVKILSTPKVGSVLYGYPIGKPCEISNEEYTLFEKSGVKLELLASEKEVEITKEKEVEKVKPKGK